MPFVRRPHRWQGALGGGGATSLLVQIQAMFSAAEQGGIYDYTSPETLFQERSGSPPASPSGADGAIGSIMDLSPRGNWARAPADADRPISRQGVGAPNVYGDFLTNDLLQTAALTLNQPATLVISWRPTTGTLGARVTDGRTLNNGILFTDSGASTVYDVFAGAILSGITVSAGEDVVASCVFNGTSSAIAKNNDAAVTGNAGTANPGGFTMGAAANATNGFVGRIYRAVFINRLLSALELAICHTWCGEAADLVL